jgi:hypothetical protein
MKNAGTYVKYYVQTCKNMIPEFYKSDGRLLEFWWDQPLLLHAMSLVQEKTKAEWIVCLPVHMIRPDRDILFIGHARNPWNY